MTTPWIAPKARSLTSCSKYIERSLVFVLKRTGLQVQVELIVALSHAVSRKSFAKNLYGTLLWHSVLFQYLKYILVVLGGGYLIFL
jgi:hypothetical protein